MLTSHSNPFPLHGSTVITTKDQVGDTVASTRTEAFLWLLQELRSAHFGLRDSYIIGCMMFLVYARWQEVISPISN